MRHKLIVSAVLASVVTGCGSTLPLARQRNPQALPSIDSSATEAGLIAAYLEICLKVAQGTPRRPGIDPRQGKQRVQRCSDA
jgi:hypothetical protein